MTLIEIGEDSEGAIITRPMTVEEDHAAYLASRGPWDEAAQRADDAWTERNWA